jgi:phage terminase large subunit GpA-like protein
VDHGPHFDLGFDGAEDLLWVWTIGLTPEPRSHVSAWADRHRILSPRGANEAGPWRTSRMPYLQELMDALSPRHSARRVVFMKGSQLGASESGCCWIGYVTHHAPGPMLAVQPSVELAKRRALSSPWRSSPPIPATKAPRSTPGRGGRVRRR